MRIVHIITGLGDGGAEGALYRLCIETARADPEAMQTVISLGSEAKYGPLLAAIGVRVHALDLKGHRFVAGLSRLFALLRGERPDVVQTWMYHANLLGGITARLAGVSNVAWGIRQSRLDPAWARVSTRLIDWLSARLSSSVPALIVSCSHRAAADHIGLGYQRRKFVVIPNGYDLATLEPDAVARTTYRQELGVGSGTFLIGMVGRWAKQKDHANLLLAVSRLERTTIPWKLALVGTAMDADNNSLTALMQAAGVADRVLLLGRRDDIPGLMNALDLHVLSSSSEAFPNVVAEAMACGTPCVVTDVGDSAEIVGETGWVVPPRDSRALARAIEQAMSELSNPETRTMRQASARARVEENFSVARMLIAYNHAWESCLG